MKIKSILLIGLALRLILLVFSNYHPDLNNHLDWGKRFWDYGPKNFYESSIWGTSWPNQPFGSILLFAGIYKVYVFIFNFILWLNNTFPFFPSKIVWVFEQHLHPWLVKLPFVLSDIGIGFLIYKILDKLNPKLKKLGTILFIFNPVIIYNSTIWGQTDSLINLLALTGIFLVWQKKYFWGIFLFLISFAFKLSLFIYFPVFLVVLVKQYRDYKKILLSFLFSILFFILISIPFSGDKKPLEWLWYMYNGKVFTRQGSMLNGNAFNFWFILFGADFSKSEFTKFGSLSYQFWSRLVYVAVSIPVIWKFFKSKFSFINIISSLMIFAFGAFIILTNMHERYLYPIFPILTVLVLLKKPFLKLPSLIILSLIHLLNLYNLWFYPEIIFLKNFLVFDHFLAGKILSGVLIFYYVYFLLEYFKSDSD